MKRWSIGLVVALALLLAGGWALHLWLFVDLPSLDTLQEGLAAPSSRILDRNGRLLYEVIDPNGGNHTPVLLSQIPEACQAAIIAVEDANYYSHPGVDVAGILRALWINLQGGETLAGGSTLTQQVARNLLLSPEEVLQRTVGRKLRESILAWRLARAYSKEEVLALYLNQVYFGNLAYGIEGAANIYFGKPAAMLDLAECAMLAGLPQAPAIFDPLTNPILARDKQSLVLELMVKEGKITTQEAARARNEPLGFAAVAFPIEAPHFVTMVWGMIESRLGTDVTRAGGLVVTTTLDLDLQHTAEETVHRHLTRLQSESPDRPAHNVHNGALVALEPVHGSVLALVGSPNYFDASIDGAVNAAMAPRQPGSALKPLTYALALDPRRPEPWTAATVLLDVRTAFVTREGDPYVPLNYDRVFHGPVSVRQALACSYNVPAVKALQAVGIDSLVRLARDLGIGTFEDVDRFGLALTLGGGEVRLIELTGAYAALANGGYRVEPQLIQSVSLGDETLYQAPVVGLAENPILDPRVAWILTDILSDDAARAPSFGHGSVLRLGRPSAVKTGTTTDWRDNWTIGYTPDLVTGVWVGNADNSPMLEVSGVTGAGPIWHSFMETALEGRPAIPFSQPDGLNEVEVCAISGKLPTELCPHRLYDWFIPGTEPKVADDWYRLFQVDRRTGLLADERTPAGSVQERVYLIVPPELQSWAREQGIPAPPPAMPTSSGPGESAAVLGITSPDEGIVYRITPAVPREGQRIRFQAVARQPLSELTFVLDGQSLGALHSPPYEMLWTLQPGQHQLMVVGRTTDDQQITSNPVHFEVLDPTP